MNKLRQFYVSAFRIYKAKFERFRIIRVTAIWAYETAHLIIGRVQKLKPRYKGFRLTLASFDSRSTKPLIVSDNFQERVPALVFFGEFGKKKIRTSDEQYISPGARVFTLHNVEVIATTDFVIQDGTLLHDKLFVARDHTSTLERFSEGILNRTGSRAWVKTVPPRVQFDSAVNLTSGSSGNFAHALNEITTKLAFFEDACFDPSIAILLDESLPRVVREVICEIKNKDREIYYLKRFQRVSVRRLFQVSNSNFAPLDIRRDSKNFGNYTVFSSPSIAMLREKLEISTKEIDAQLGTKIFLRRANKVIPGVQENPGRVVSNQKQVENYLIGRNFEVISPENYSLGEIRTKLQEASVVVAPIGASLANAIFTRPGARIVALSPVFSNADYTYHRRMMASYNRDYSVVLGKQFQNIGPNYPFEIDPTDLSLALDFHGLK